MALNITFGDTQFSVGDRIRVSQRIREGEKTRTQIFEGIVLAIKGRGNNKMFTARRVGAGGIGVERIFPLGATTIEKIEVIKKAQGGVRRAKLYYVRTKSPKEIEKIYSKKISIIKKTRPKRKSSKKS